MRITLDSFDYIEDPDYFTPAQTLSWYRRSRDIQTIVIHWWNSPDKAGTFDQTVNYLKGADESIHFVVSDTRIVQMVNLNYTAFHAMGANPISVGIEVDPRVPGKTYEAVGGLVRFIRETLGKDLPLSRHSDHVSTSCPGTIDLAKIEYWSRHDTPPAPIPAPTPVPAPVQVSWRVKDLDGKQLGAYTVDKNAWLKYESVNRSAKIFDANGTDVTQSFIVKFDPPVPTPPAPVPVYNPAKDAEQDKRLTAIELLLTKIADFLASVFSGFKK